MMTESCPWLRGQTKYCPPFDRLFQASNRPVGFSVLEGRASRNASIIFPRQRHGKCLRSHQVVTN